jgi:TPR repeat protein
LLAKGFAEIGVQRITASAMTVNEGSRRVMEKIGMQHIRTDFPKWRDRLPGSEEGEVEYEITREGWQRAMNDHVWLLEPDLQRLKNAAKLVETDPEGAIEIFRQLAANGSIKSMAFLGTIYRRAQGVKRDLAEAERWYQGAALRSYIPASYALGLTYLKTGYHRKAAVQFEIGARANHNASTYMFGEMLYQGVPRDVPRARDLWERANAKDYLPAKAALGKLLVEGHFGVMPGFRGIWLRLEATLMRAYLKRRKPDDPRLA